jgi:hypothetical protein
MKVRATIGLTIDIDSEREMGLDIEDSEIENYAVENMVEYLYELLKHNDFGDVIKVEREGN